MEIIIWDIDAQRIAKIDRNLHAALRQLKFKAVVSSMSEPPLLARMDLLHKVPVLEIDGQYWSLQPNTDLSFASCLQLLKFVHSLSFQL